MCCTTHHDRDVAELNAGVDVTVLLATDDRLRCRCTFGHPCGRKATEEDGLCTWCRQAGGEDGHYRFCGDAMNAQQIRMIQSQASVQDWLFSGGSL